MTRSKAQLSKHLTNFQVSNSFSDKEVAEMLQTTSLTVFRIKKGLVEWISEINQYLLNEMGIEFKMKKLVDGILIYTEDNNET